MAQVSCWPLVAEDQVQSQASPKNVVGCTMAQVVSSMVAGLWLQMPPFQSQACSSGTVTGFSSSTVVFPL